MKFLLLFSTLFPALAFATSPDIPANDADAHGVWGSSFYRGTAVHTRADGTEQQALVALETVRMPSTDHRSAMLFVYPDFRMRMLFYFLLFPKTPYF